MQSPDWVIAHLHALKHHKMTNRDIARCAGVNEATIHRLLAGGNTIVFPQTARAIMAVRPDTPTWREEKAWTNPTGTIRRLQALMAVGHDGQAISTRAGKHREWASRILRGAASQGYIEERTRVAVAEIYDQMWMDAPTGSYANRTRAIAARRGYMPPLAWDDDTIDDPTATPQITGPKTDVLDELEDLITSGTDARTAAATIGKPPATLARFARRHNRPDLARLLERKAA